LINYWGVSSFDFVVVVPGKEKQVLAIFERIEKRVVADRMERVERMEMNEKIGNCCVGVLKLLHFWFLQKLGCCRNQGIFLF